MSTNYGEAMPDAKLKVLDLVSLREKVDALKKAGQRLVFTNGCFDLLHLGHVRYLEEARRQGDCLIVAVNSDRSVRQIKRRCRPVVPQAQRAEVVAALASVDWVTIFDEPDPLALIQFLMPDVLVKGADWGEEHIVGATEVKAAGGEVVRITLEPGISTSDLIKRICSACANADHDKGV
jgi:rfaE bifunctional protein nucleotidyltransferase chain/domain